MSEVYVLVSSFENRRRDPEVIVEAAYVDRVMAEAEATRRNDEIRANDDGLYSPNPRYGPWWKVLAIKVIS